MSVHDLWGGKRTGPGRRWEVRWRDAGRQRKRRFTTRQAADAWNAKVTLSPGEGRSTPTVATVYAEWLSARSDLRPSTLAGYKSVWALYVEPSFGPVPVDRIRAGEVQTWVGELAGRTRSRARGALTVLSGVMRLAVMQGYVDANPCASVRWPELPRAEVTPLTRDQVRKLADAAGPHGLVVWVLAVTGMRFGEMAGLRVQDLDAKRNRLHIVRSATEVNGVLSIGPPKSGKSREVPIPAWLTKQLRARTVGRQKNAPLLVTEQGQMWRRGTWRRVWRGQGARPGDRQSKPGILELADVPTTTRTHDLRHTAAVRMLEDGVTPRTVQEVLGHASLTMTLDLYGRWAAVDLDGAVAGWESV